MYCPKCGSKLDESDKFCKNCGENLDDKHKEQFEYDYSHTNVTDDDLKKAYIGNNYEKLKKGRFSLPTLFLGIYYLLYRKMWLYSLLWLIITVLSTIGVYVYKISYLSLLPMIYIILLSALFTNLYSKKVDKEIMKIRKNNSDKSNDELLSICKKKGGVSVGAVVTVIILIISTLIVVMSVFIADTFTKALEDNEYKNRKTYNNESELAYKLPDIFKEKNHANDSYENFSYYGNKDSCTVDISNYEIYSEKTAEEYLKDSITTNMNETVSEIKSKEINQNIWSYVEVTSPDKVTFYYACIYNNRIYEVTYKIYSDGSSLCSKAHDELINSLIFSKNSGSINSV